MKHTRNRILSIFAAAALTVCSLPQSTPLLLRPAITASAADSGTCGENVNWAYDTETKTLTISGTGNMNDYQDIPAPWNEYDIHNAVIEDGVENIGNCAFEKVPGLTGISIPDSVREIGGFAFSNCRNLTEIKLPNGLTSIGKYTFYKCSGLTSIILSDSVTSIDAYAFCGCSGLTSITIPDSVTSIGAGAFGNCEVLADVRMPKGVTEIGESAFHETQWLRDRQAENPLVVVNDILIDGTACEGAVTVPQGVRIIGARAFFIAGFNENNMLSYNNKLTSVTLPDSVTEIGEMAFYYCKSLTDVTFGNALEVIADSAFSYCGALTDIVLPEGLTNIGSAAFCGCEKLKSIMIPDTVTSIGMSAYHGCKNLKIRGCEGSTAQTYAKENGCEFEALNEAVRTTTATVTTTIPTEATPTVTTFAAAATQRGDVTGDSTVSVDDAQLILKAYTERIAGNDMGLTAGQIKAADVDGNGEISVDDAQNILKYYTEKSVAGKDTTWDEILGKKTQTLPRLTGKRNTSLKLK